jgi:hypothetical protein
MERAVAVDPQYAVLGSRSFQYDRQHLVTHTPTSRLDPGVPTKDPAIGGTDSGNLATATGK